MSEMTLFSCFVEVTGLEPATAWSQTRNATNCATPRFAAAKVLIIFEIYDLRFEIFSLIKIF